MAKKEHYYTQFENNRIYHVYNRTIDRKPMFKSDENYAFFIRQFDKYLSAYINIYTYNLIGNHFHFMIQIKDLSDLTNTIVKTDLTTFEKLPNLKKQKTTHDIVSHQFKKFFQSYAMAFNKQQNRIGTLFQTPFKRVEVRDEEYLRELICYIHTNAQKHQIVKDFREWKWLSYHKILSKKETKLLRNEVIEYFNDKENFEYTHLLFAKKIEEKERDFFIED
ncbi:transposase [Flavobacterium jejuense]|uniref:Transposase n=1 Tax=Flavobacterium jejuense TaxID=1544455 RepID=A0ABX0IV22_9FLAO|nr:transposase [Flavobacterium jejuense]NHN26383.1 transposase [Flavobacterium jejuense]